LHNRQLVGPDPVETRYFASRERYIDSSDEIVMQMLQVPSREMIIKILPPMTGMRTLISLISPTTVKTTIMKFWDIAKKLRLQMSPITQQKLQQKLHITKKKADATKMMSCGLSGFAFTSLSFSSCL